MRGTSVLAAVLCRRRGLWHFLATRLRRNPLKTRSHRFGPAVAFFGGMSVAASRAPSTGIDSAFAAAPITPMSRTSSSASATQTAPFPRLFGQMVDSENEDQTSDSRGAALGSKATAAPTAGASKTAVGEKNRTASGASGSDPGQSPVASDFASAGAPPPWLPQAGHLAFTLVSRGPFPETRNTSGDGAADQVASVLANSDAELASAPVPASHPVATARNATNLGPTFADTSVLCLCGEQRSNPATEGAEATANQPAEPAQTTGSISAAPTERESESSGAQTIPAATLNATWGTVDRALRFAPLNAGSSGRVQSSSLSDAAAPTEDQASETSRKPALPAQNLAARTPEPRAADPAGAAPASSVAVDVVDNAASLFAQLVARSGGRTSEPDGVALEQGDATVAGGYADQFGGDGFGEEGTLAFQALLVPASASDSPPANQTPQAASNSSTCENPSTGTSAGSSGSRSSAPTVRDPDLGLALAAQTGPAGGTAQTVLTAEPVSVNSDVGAAAWGTSRNHGAEPSPASPSAESVAAPAAQAQPAAGGAAREIRLELRDADARVNLRLVERAGAVQVDVRTPDSHLASSLRDDLPALAARLEQTGLRAESWHDAPAAPAGRVRMAESVSSASSQLSQDQSRREGGGRDPQDGRPPEKRQPIQPKSKEFSWLYTSLT